MNDMQSFKQFLATHQVEIPVGLFLAHLGLAILAALALGAVYVRFGTSLSNRRAFARTFGPITATTMLLIILVKSSLALSLGLVGALSIVRFRTAIKEPEELAYLFLCIALGVGFGAGAALITGVGFVVVAALLVLIGRRAAGQRQSTALLSVRYEGDAAPTYAALLAPIEPRCRRLMLRRLDEDDRGIEALFEVELNSIEDVEPLRAELRALSEGAVLTLSDQHAP